MAGVASDPEGFQVRPPAAGAPAWRAGTGAGTGRNTLPKCLGAVIEHSGGRVRLGGRAICDDGRKIADLRAMAVARILDPTAARHDMAIIVVTHDEKVIPTFKRLHRMRDGRTHEERRDRTGA